MAEDANVINNRGVCIIEQCLPLRISISMNNLEDKSWLVSREGFFDRRRFSCEYALKAGDITRWWNKKYKPQFHTGFTITDGEPKHRTILYKRFMRIKDWDKSIAPHKSRYDLLMRSKEEYVKIGGGAYSQTQELRMLNRMLRYDLKSDAWTLLLDRFGGDYMKTLIKVRKQFTEQYAEDQLQMLGEDFLQFLLSEIDPSLYEAVPDWMKFD